MNAPIDNRIQNGWRGTLLFYGTEVIRGHGSLSPRQVRMLEGRTDPLPPNDRLAALYAKLQGKQSGPGAGGSRDPRSPRQSPERPRSGGGAVHDGDHRDRRAA